MSDGTNDMAVSWTHSNGARSDLKYVDDDLEYVATHAAETFYTQHDGWECEWPQIFFFQNSDGEYLGAVEVDMEMEPSFCNAGLIDCQDRSGSGGDK